MFGLRELRFMLREVSKTTTHRWRSFYGWQWKRGFYVTQEQVGHDEVKVKVKFWLTVHVHSEIEAKYENIYHFILFWIVSNKNNF